MVIPGHHEGRLSGIHFLATDHICTSAIFVRLTNRSSEVYDLASIVVYVCLSWLKPVNLAGLQDTPRGVLI